MTTIMDVAAAAIALGMSGVVALPSNAGWTTKVGSVVHGVALFALLWLGARTLIGVAS